MQELLTQFGINWELLLAQAVNFFILLVILKIFAYKPVMKMLDDRRKKIQEGLEASEESKKKLAETSVQEALILRKANDQAISVVDAAEAEAALQAKNMLDAAHTKSEQVIASGQRKLEEERQELSLDVRRHAEELVRLSIERVIGKLTPAERERLLVAEALQELGKTAALS